jgi:hypothetical protein
MADVRLENLVFNKKRGCRWHPLFTAAFTAAVLL